MNKTPSEPPEWDYFARLENLEKLKPTVNDAYILALSAFILGYMAAVNANPKSARKFKDSWLRVFKSRGLSTETLKQLESILLDLCEEAEKYE